MKFMIRLFRFYTTLPKKLDLIQNINLKQLLKSELNLLQSDFKSQSESIDECFHYLKETSSQQLKSTSIFTLFINRDSFYSKTLKSLSNDAHEHSLKSTESQVIIPTFL